MSETYFSADLHLDHSNVLKHCKRRWLRQGDLDDKGRWVSNEIKLARTEEMNEGIVNSWNSVVGKHDTVYIVGDMAWKNHRKWIMALNGKKILIVGNHDKMPQDCLDLFKPDWTCEDMTLKEAVRNMVQFREVHWKLRRKICGQDMTIIHEPMRSWPNSCHGSICLCGHSHGRCKESRPGEIGGGLILDVGWDIWHKPLSFDEIMKEMRIKLDLMPQNFRDHVLYGKRLEYTEDEIID